MTIQGELEVILVCAHHGLNFVLDFFILNVTIMAPYA